MLNTYKTTDRQPLRAIVYGTQKVGKTTYAAGWPSPVFICSEDGAQGMGVDAFPVCTTWQEVMAHLTALAKEDHAHKTVVIDALDGIERLIWASVCKDAGVDSIEKVEKGFGKGYAIALEQWQRLIAGLTYLRDRKGMRCLLLAHAHTRKIVSPDMPDVDRYEPQLNAKAGALLMQWADLIGLARVQTIVTKEGKAVSTGQRMLCCQDSAAALAGNRYSITEAIPLTWAATAAAIKEAK